MKYLKLLSVMVSCFMAAASVQAMEEQEVGNVKSSQAAHSFEQKFKANMKIEEDTCLAKAAFFAVQSGSSRNRKVFSDEIYNEISAINALRAGLRSIDIRDELLVERGNNLFAQVSSAYRQDLDSLSILRQQLDEIVSKDVWDENCEVVALHYMHALLLNELGDGQKAGDQRKKAYYLLSRLRKDKPKEYFEELFYYFPDTPLAEEGRNNLKTSIEKERIRNRKTWRISADFKYRSALLNFGERALEQARLSQGAGDAAAAASGGSE